MDEQVEQQVKQQALTLLEKSGFPVTKTEKEQLEVNDFDLGNIYKEGFTFIDILRSERLRITLHILLPGQTLPQHKHPAYDNEPGKEETMRALWGEFRVFIKGDENAASVSIPDSKESYYTARKQIVLHAGETFTVPPGMDHWFQAGPEGAVALAFQNRVDETRNIFYDPASAGCPIPLDED